MNQVRSTQLFDIALLFVLFVVLQFTLAGNASAQRRGVSRQGSRVSSPIKTGTVPASFKGRTALRSITPLPPNVNPFEDLESSDGVNNIRTINFVRTNLDGKAEATAEVALRDRTLLVRMRASDVPMPAAFGTPRYAMWVYVPNYGVRIYIGDLPIVPTSKSRGKSDSAYRYVRMPPKAVFGGLMLTAEPVRYEPVVNEPLRPLLIGLAEGVNPRYANSSLTIYSYPLPPARARGSRRPQPKPRAGSNRQTATPRPSVRTNQ